MKTYALTAFILTAAAVAAPVPPGDTPLLSVQKEPPAPPPDSWVAQVLPAGAFKPVAIGEHNCLSQYPGHERGAQIEGTTSLSYRIAEDGSVKAVKVVTSSGNSALDKAAVACVKAWQYRSAILDQKPVEIEWRNDVKWVIKVNPPIAWAPTQPGARSGITPPVPLPAPPPSPKAAVPPPPAPQLSATPASPPQSAPASVGHPHVCLAMYPPDAVAEHAQGTATIGFFISEEGKVVDLHMVRSSGYAALDEAAQKCAKDWLYKPAMKDGAPVAVPWKAEVKWLMH